MENLIIFMNIIVIKIGIFSLINLEIGNLVLFIIFSLIEIIINLC